MKRQFNFSKDLPEEKKSLVEKELKLGFLNLSESFFEAAKMNFEVVLALDEKAPDGFWGLMLAKLEVSNEDEIASHPENFEQILQMEECQKAQELATEDVKAVYESLLENVKKLAEAAEEEELEEEEDGGLTEDSEEEDEEGDDAEEEE